MLRPPTPEDLYRFRIPTDPQLSPDGALVAVTVQSVAAGRDGYRHAVWLVPADGSAPPRQVTLGTRHDTHPRFSPDGTALAFLSDRRPLVEEEPDAPKDREDGTQVHLLPLGGGEARRLTDLPRGVDAFEWSPDGRWLVVRTTSFGATRSEDRKARRKAEPPKPGATPLSDYRYFDRLQGMLNGPGFIDDKVGHLWLVDVETGAARRLTNGPVSDAEPAWSPDGTRIAFTASRGRDHDLDYQFDVFVVEVATERVTRITDGAACAFGAAAWLPDGATLALAGHRWPRAGGSRNDIWLFPADGSEAHRGGGRNLSGPSDLMFGAGMVSDVTPGEASFLRVTPDARHLLFTAPVRGAYELWRIALADGSAERLTEDRHYLSGWAVVATADGGARVAAIRSTATELPDVHVLDLEADGRVAAGRVAGSGEPRRITSFNDAVLAGLDLRAPEEGWETVDGREVQGWLIRCAAAEQGEPAPIVLQIHGGPHALYGWAPNWEYQVLAGAGVSVLFTNPRGSEGYGEDFNSANLPDWANGPMRDVMAHVESLVDAGVADPARLGVTGGSYGGYLTNWIVGHTDRFAAAMTCRSVSDLTSLMLTGDLAGGIFGIMEFGAQPWEKPDLYRELSPITYADAIHTPLLIQHAENDLRCPIGQAEALFAVLRTLKRPVRLMRVPSETHELTRSGTPFRRVENLVQVRGWFDHFLVQGKKKLPPLPAHRAGI
jgi:dipeptidyl aminopeptidase/acylaminoacyl peptidase